VTSISDNQVGLREITGKAFGGFQNASVFLFITIGKPFRQPEPLAAVGVTPAGRKVCRTYGFLTLLEETQFPVLLIHVLNPLNEALARNMLLVVSDYLKKGVKKNSQEFPMIGDCGAKLFLGIELGDAQETPLAAPPTAYLANR